MARTELERTVQQSVLDRLIDDDPPVTWAQSVRRLKLALRRDLDWLLNTRRTPEAVPEGFAELRRSLFYYGLPDITSLSYDSPEDRIRLLRRVEDTIATFEPRLANVRVSMVETEEGGDKKLRFLIEGLLRMDPQPEQVVFDTVLELASGQYQVTEG